MFPGLRSVKLDVLVIGSDGVVGTAIRKEFADHPEFNAHVLATTRRGQRGPDSVFLNMLEPDAMSFWSQARLCRVELAFMCAGINGFKECEGQPESWRINVDGTLYVALRLIKERGVFVVYPSTQAVEWLGSAYARQRAQVEAALLATWQAAIVRIGRTTKGNGRACAEALVRHGLRRRPGTYYWTG